MPRASPSRRPFLARPFWRDYVLGGALVGVGFVLSAPHAPVHPSVGITPVIGGEVILLLAIAWSVRAAWRDRTHSP